jgi:hypothetical protein
MSHHYTVNGWNLIGIQWNLNGHLMEYGWISCQPWTIMIIKCFCIRFVGDDNLPPKSHNTYMPCMGYTQLQTPTNLDYILGVLEGYA